MPKSPKLSLPARPITRRDFINGGLAGGAAGALLTGGCGRSTQSSAPGRLGPDWTGPGGVGDYARSNGNTAQVVNAAHGVRDLEYPANAHEQAEATGEAYDLVVVGGGIAGLSAAYEHQKRYGPDRSCLVLENHPIYGGEAKGNVFEVDGVRLEAPQGSNGTVAIEAGPLGRLWADLRLPVDYAFAELTGASDGVRAAKDHYAAMLWSPQDAATAVRGPSGGWVSDPWAGDFSIPGFDPAEAGALSQWWGSQNDYGPGGAASGSVDDIVAWRARMEGSPTARWLDTMSYREFIGDVMGLDAAAVCRFADPIVAVSIGGLGADALSAYAAQRIMLPGVAPASVRAGFSGLWSYPTGNAVIARHIVAAMRPDVFEGDDFIQIARGSTDLRRLAEMRDGVAIRHECTVIDVRHAGSTNTSDEVHVTYVEEGGLKRVAARNVIMASGGWVNRRVVADMPDDIAEAYFSFVHAPVLVANVAVRHWRFLDRMGASAARWFDGFGFYTNVRQPMMIGDDLGRFSPDQPTVLTFYVPFTQPGLSPAVQASMGREALLAPTFAEFETQIRAQMQDVFGPFGFDHRNDIAGVILNRWGHAYVTPEPGFFFGRDGAGAPRDAIRRGYGRIQFAHSELQGNQSWTGAYLEAERAVSSL